MGELATSRLGLRDATEGPEDPSSDSLGAHDARSGGVAPAGPRALGADVQCRVDTRPAVGCPLASSAAQGAAVCAS